jgi:hypothetical protein
MSGRLVPPVSVSQSAQCASSACDLLSRVIPIRLLIALLLQIEFVIPIADLLPILLLPPIPTRLLIASVRLSAQIPRERFDANSGWIPPTRAATGQRQHPIQDARQPIGVIGRNRD